MLLFSKNVKHWKIPINLLFFFPFLMPQLKVCHCSNSLCVSAPMIKLFCLLPVLRFSINYVVVSESKAQVGKVNLGAVSSYAQTWCLPSFFISLQWGTRRQLSTEQTCWASLMRVNVITSITVALMLNNNFIKSSTYCGFIFNWTPFLFARWKDDRMSLDFRCNFFLTVWIQLLTQGQPHFAALSLFFSLTCDAQRHCSC